MVENFKRPYLTKNNLQVADTLSDLLHVLYVCTTLSHHVYQQWPVTIVKRYVTFRKKKWAPPHWVNRVNEWKGQYLTASIQNTVPFHLFQNLMPFILFFGQ